MKNHIEDFLKHHKIKAYHIFDDHSVDVYESVRLLPSGYNKLPVKFNNAISSFDSGLNPLTTLKNFPRFVGGNLIFDYRSLPRINISFTEVCGMIYSYTGVRFKF